MTTSNGSNIYRGPGRADAGQAGIDDETKKPRHLRAILRAASFRI
jgi:hypothetical protein